MNCPKTGKRPTLETCKGCNAAAIINEAWQVVICGQPDKPKKVRR